jgi:hypothetical protein
MGLDSAQLEWVAQHLGHSIDIQKTYYRVTSSIIEKAKIAKLLILADKGKGDMMKGKSFDDISTGKTHQLFHFICIFCCTVNVHRHTTNNNSCL